MKGHRAEQREKEGQLHPGGGQGKEQRSQGIVQHIVYVFDTGNAPEINMTQTVVGSSWSGWVKSEPLPQSMKLRGVTPEGVVGCGCHHLLSVALSQRHCS